MKELISGAKILVKKPVILIAAFLTGLLSSLIFSFFSPFTDKIITETLIFGNIPKTGFFELPKALIYTHPIESIASILLMFFSLTLFSVFYMFSMHKTRNRKGLPKKIITKSISFAFAITLFLQGLFLLALLFLSLTAYSALLSFILLTVLLVLSAYLLLRFVFTTFFLAKKDNNLKKALKQSWRTTSKNRLFLAIFLLVLSTITGILSWLLLFFIQPFIQNSFYFIFYAIATSIPNAYQASALSLKAINSLKQ